MARPAKRSGDSRRRGIRLAFVSACVCKRAPRRSNARVERPWWLEDREDTDYCVSPARRASAAHGAREAGHQRVVTTGSKKSVSYTHLRAHETRHELVC